MCVCVCVCVNRLDRLNLSSVGSSALTFIDVRQVDSLARVLGSHLTSVHLPGMIQKMKLLVAVKRCVDYNARIRVNAAKVHCASQPFLLC